MKTKMLFVIALLTTGLASAATPRSQVQAYTVLGNVELKSIRHSTNDGSFYYELQTNHFELQSRDCRWLVKLGTHDPKVYDYRIVSSDGASTYLLLSYETRQKINALEGKGPLPNVGDGNVTSGNIPRFGLAEEAGAVWIAYASWCHFAEDSYSRRRPVPFANYVSPSPRSAGEPPAVENALWQLSASPPHLPTTLVYCVENTADPGGPSPQAPNGANRFTNVVYEAISFVDFEGLRLPKEAMVSIYRLISTPPGNTVTQLCEQMRMLGTNMISGVELESFKPKLPGRTIISEERFNNGSGLSFAYFSDNHWPSEPTARTSDAYKEAKLRLTGDDETFLPKGTNAPNFSFVALAGGQEKTLSEYKGKVVVLEFWTTWCPGCQPAMEELQTYRKRYPNWANKVALLALSLDDDRERAAKHVQRKGWNKTDNFWTTKDIYKLYRFEGIPMVYILDQRGNIAVAGHELNIPEHVNRLLHEDRQ